MNACCSHISILLSRPVFSFHHVVVVCVIIKMVQLMNISMPINESLPLSFMTLLLCRPPDTFVDMPADCLCVRQSTCQQGN